jgi:hypothetical protein
MAYTKSKEIPKTPAGIEGFDATTDGGLPRGRTTLVLGGACSGKTVLAMEFLVKGASLYEEPLWRKHKLLATPVAIRRLPLPEGRVIGGLSVAQQVLKGLGIPKPAVPDALREMPEVGRG